MPGLWLDIFQKVKALEYTFPEGFDPHARDLVQRLLVREPAARLGAEPVYKPNVTLRGLASLDVAI